MMELRTDVSHQVGVNDALLVLNGGHTVTTMRSHLNQPGILAEA